MVMRTVPGPPGILFSVRTGCVMNRLGSYSQSEWCALDRKGSDSGVF